MVIVREIDVQVAARTVDGARPEVEDTQPSLVVRCNVKCYWLFAGTARHTPIGAFVIHDAQVAHGALGGHLVARFVGQNAAASRGLFAENYL